MKIPLALFLFIGTFVSTFAQKLPPSEDRTPAQTERARREENRRIDESFGNLQRLGRPNSVEVSLTKISAPPVAKLTKDQAKELIPEIAESTRFAEFLKMPRTGLVKLFPDFDCELKYVVSAGENCRKLIPRSSFFSFRARNYSIKTLSDIRLKDNVLISDGILSQGIIVALGDVSIDTISTESNGVNFLSVYEPTHKNREDLENSKIFSIGLLDSGYKYSQTVPLIENTTYAIRVIAYRGSILTPLDVGFYYDLLEEDPRNDIIAAFRVVRKNENGSVTLLWKELAVKKAPKLKFSKEN